MCNFRFIFLRLQLDVRAECATCYFFRRPKRRRKKMEAFVRFEVVAIAQMCKIHMQSDLFRSCKSHSIL